MTNSREPLHTAFWLVPCAMLLLALAPWPYGYYRLLRLVVCGCVGFLAYRLREQEKTSWTVALSATAVIFNPLIPLHLTREIWAVLNVCGAAVIAFHYFAWRSASDKEQDQKSILKGTLE